jgi:GNAT superfamily N-acetyltransferase
MFCGAWLARRLEAAEAANDGDCIAAQPGATVERVGDAWILFAGAESPLTRALGVGLDGMQAVDALDRVEHFFQARNARPAIDLCPLVSPDFLELFAKRGYRATEFNNVMVRGLANVAMPPEDPRVRRSDDAERWSRVVGEGYFDTPVLSEDEIAVGLAVFGAERAQCFLAWTESGEDAAGAALSAREGTAVLFADSTIARFRRNGLQQSLIRARLGAALALGCDIACAVTTPGSASQRNYERLGFQVAYTKMLMRR